MVIIDRLINCPLFYGFGREHTGYICIFYNITMTGRLIRTFGDNANTYFLNNLLFTIRSITSSFWYLEMGI
jgi:hypothetical protein